MFDKFFRIFQSKKIQESSENFCYRCDNLLEKTNTSKEHIILNSLGGRLKSKKLLCINCNSTLGNILDADLAEDANLFMNLLLAKRERGEPQNIEGIVKLTGDPAVLNNKGKVNYAHPIVNNDPDDFLIKVNSLKQYKKVIQNLKKRIPDLDEEAMIKTLEFSKMPKEFTWIMKWSGAQIYPVVIKMMISYYLHENGKIKFIKHLLPFIEKKEVYKKVIHYLPAVPLYIPGNNEVSQVVKIIGNPKRKLLYAYFEIFNFYPILALINDDYTGKAIDLAYGINILSGEEFVPKINMSFDRAFFNDLDYTKHTQVPIERVNDRINRITFMIAHRQIEKDVKEKINNILMAYDSKVTSDLNNMPENIKKEIEEAIAELEFKIEYKHIGTDAPPEDITERRKYLFDLLKKEPE